MVRLSVMGQILRRRRRLLASLAVLGAVAGTLAWVLVPAAFASTSKVLLQGSRSEDEVLTEAQIAASRVVVDRAIAGLGWEPGTVGRDAVSAEVGDGNVIDITVRAETPSRARELAERVTEEYLTFSTEIATRAADAAAGALRGRRADLQRQVDELDRRLGSVPAPAAPPDARAPVGTAASSTADGLRTAHTELLRELHDIEGRIAETQAQAAVGRANIRVIEPATHPSDPATPSLPQLVAGGMVLAPVLGTVVLVALRLADRRLRRKSDIAAALAAPVLGTVPAAANGAPTEAQTGGRRALLRWLLGDGLPAMAPADRSLEPLRWRRVLDRLRGAPDDRLRLLVVVAADDRAALGAVARLAGAVADDGQVSVLTDLTDCPQLTAAVEPPAAGDDPEAVPVEVTTRRSLGPAPTTVLRVVSVTATRPTIPSDSEASSAVLVVTAGTRTGWELLAVAEACHEAMLPVLGAVVVVAPGEEETVEGEPQPAAPQQPAAAAGQLNGQLTGGRA